MAQTLFSSISPRFLALRAPSFSTDRLKRDAPSKALVLYEKSHNALRVFSCDEAAAAGGVYAGQPLADARAILPALEARPADQAGDARAFRKLAFALLRYAPFVGVPRMGEAVLSVTGGAHLFGGEAALLDDLLARLSRAGITARAAIASTPGAAFAGAYAFPRAITPQDATQEFLRALPVDALRLDEAHTEGLKRLGLARIGQLYDLPRAPLAARFGPMLLKRLDQALGAEEEPITPIVPPPDYAADAGFVEPLTSAEEIETALTRLARTLERQLERDGAGARRFELLLFGLDRRTRRIAVGCGRPTRRAAHLLRLFRNRIESAYDPREAGFGYDRARLSAYGAEAARPAVYSSLPLAADPPLAPPLQGGEETEFFGAHSSTRKGIPPLEKGGLGGDPPRARRRRDARSALPLIAPPTHDLSELQDALASRLGEHAVRRPVLADAHLPEKAGEFVAAAPPFVRTTPQDGAAPRPLLLFARPEPIEAVAAVPDGAPMRFFWRRIAYPVTRARGPERIAADWFAAPTPAATRDYYALEDDEGRRYWVFREGLYGRETTAPKWFLHGLFP